MKRSKWAIGFIVLLVAFSIVSAQYHFFLRADRYWDNDGVFSTDNVIQSAGTSNALRAKYSGSLYADLTADSSGNLVIDSYSGVIKHQYDAAAYWTATQADAAAVTFNSVSDGTPGFAFSDKIDLTGVFTILADAAAYTTFTQADAGGLTINCTSDGTASVTFSDPVSLGTGELTAGSINRAANIMTLEIAGTSVVNVASTGANVAGTFAKTTTVTSDTTDGAGTHTAAEMLGGWIIRSGMTVGAKTDVTDTAANIVAAIPGAVVGSSFVFYIQNADNDIGVLLDGGVGVTISPNDPSTAIPFANTGMFLVVCTNVTTAAVTVYARGYSVH